MSKKTFIIIATTLILILLALVGYYFLIRTNSATNSDGTSSNVFGFLPFGNNGVPAGGGQIASTTIAIEGVQNNATNPLNTPLQKLRQISAEPVSGAGTMDIKIGTSTKSTQTGTVVRYIEKATGHIFMADLFDTVQDRISNTTIPLAYDAIWGNSNNSLIARYLEENNQTVDTYSLTLKNTSTTTENTISGIKFPANISDVSVLGANVFYLQESATGSTGYISNFSGSSRKQVWASQIRDVLGQFVNTNTVAIATKPLQNLSGYLYFVNTSSGTVSKILGDVPGLSSLSNPDATRVLYVAQGNGISMYLYTIADKSSVNITPATFPEKCVWSKKNTAIVYCAVPEDGLSGSSLTSWWQGFFSTTDDIWQIDSKANTASLLANLSNLSGQAIDVVKPILSDNERYIVFQNRRDNSLWSLDLTK